MIVIVDYGVGNISSIRNMLVKAGSPNVVASRDPDVIRCAQKLVLPGVGAFDHGMESLASNKLIEPLSDASVRRGTPTLGICLGMQLMCASSEEGRLPGLGWVDARVTRFRISSGSVLKVPHMGWNTIRVCRHNLLIDAEATEQRFYFVHSYYVECRRDSDILATATHGCEFVAAFGSSNIYGVQFHPEKSHRFGLELIRRFAALPC